MGGEQSRLETTNWDTADGGLSPDHFCVTGHPPTTEFKTITLKKDKILNNYNYTILDADGSTIATTTALAKGSAKILGEYTGVFDLEGGSPLHKLARVKRDMFGSGSWMDGWTIYSLQPSYEGQKPDPKAHLENEFKGLKWLPKKTTEYYKGDDAALFKAYHVKLNPSREHITVSTYGAPEKESDYGVGGELVPFLKVERVKVPLLSINFDTFQSSRPGESGLLSYWEWKNTTMEHKMEMKLAKGVDAGMHACMAILINLVKELESGGTTGGS
eukprot:CAMPEP_0197439422 /NCGR_PEP_ID=MMETSP1175-20131217/6176_1 /TAXON_ID=1003142 /ORGANISM="Triceratium dubium, Strain CCMP147" /LENGTH=272 /DNA_ID=CAMNT_0042969337 /DNA_START=30 /DNA_END=848 /DNA_ORIENTATION=-